MNYAEALDYIFSIPKFSYPLGNEKLCALLERLGNPQKGMRILHIAGTNGKGSAAAMLCAILTECGYKTGLFISPFIQRFNERIMIGQTPIADDALAKICEKVKREQTGVSQFAFILACAFLYYKEQNCDFVVLEAGLGGRLDATNVIDESLVSVIMSIGLDHTEYLGDTIAEIAAEKCGIIKNGGTVAAYKNKNEAAEIIKTACRAKNARLYIAPEAEKTERGFIADGKEYELGLSGEYQAENAAAVLAAVSAMRDKGIVIPEDALCRALKNCTFRARFQKIGENIIVDGAHNPDGIAALCRSVEKISGKKNAVCAMMQDKAVGECASLLASAFDEIIVTELDMPRCMSAESLFAEFPEGSSPRIIKDCRRAFSEAALLQNTCVICGSLYLAGCALNYFDEK